MRVANTRLDGNPKTPHYAGTTQKVNGKPVWTGKVARASEKTLTKPLHWAKPRAIFVDSMGDLFHEDVPDEWIDEVFFMMNLSRRHIFIILTKRAKRMRDYMASMSPWYRVEHKRLTQIFGSKEKSAAARYIGMAREQPWPLPNVWFGVPVEDQKHADERIPHLLDTPAAIRLVCCEPLLRAVDLTRVYDNHQLEYIDAVQGTRISVGDEFCCNDMPALDWVIAGGESGPDARPMHPDWVRSLRDQCQTADVPFFFQGWGEWIPWEPDCLPYWQAQNGRYEDRHVLFPAEMDNDPNWDDGLSYINQGESSVALQRIGKARAGRLLDDVEHNGFPKIKE